MVRWCCYVRISSEFSFFPLIIQLGGALVVLEALLALVRGWFKGPSLGFSWQLLICLGGFVRSDSLPPPVCFFLFIYLCPLSPFGSFG